MEVIEVTEMTITRQATGETCVKNLHQDQVVDMTVIMTGFPGMGTVTTGEMATGNGLTIELVPHNL